MKTKAKILNDYIESLLKDKKPKKTAGKVIFSPEGRLAFWFCLLRKKPKPRKEFFLALKNVLKKRFQEKFSISQPSFFQFRPRFAFLVVVLLLMVGLSFWQIFPKKESLVLEIKEMENELESLEAEIEEVAVLTEESGEIEIGEF